jgi:hypothetical protein
MRLSLRRARSRDSRSTNGRYEGVPTTGTKGCMAIPIQEVVEAKAIGTIPARTSMLRVLCWSKWQDLLVDAAPRNAARVSRRMRIEMRPSPRVRGSEKAFYCIYRAPGLLQDMDAIWSKAHQGSGKPVSFSPLWASFSWSVDFLALI